MPYAQGTSISSSLISLYYKRELLAVVGESPTLLYSRALIIRRQAEENLPTVRWIQSQNETILTENPLHIRSDRASVEV
jgi:hypothetical protein